MFFAMSYRLSVISDAKPNKRREPSRDGNHCQQVLALALLWRCVVKFYGFHFNPLLEVVEEASSGSGLVGRHRIHKNLETILFQNCHKLRR